MSLLMQALKKAEQIKQKQSGIVADEALTLSPKELSAEPEKVAITFIFAIDTGIFNYDRPHENN